MAGPNPPTAAQPDATLEALRRLARDGYAGSFAVLTRGRVRCDRCRAVAHASRVALQQLERVDTNTDPDDQQAVAGLRCPACGAKGTAVFSYGPGGSAEDGEALAALRDERRGATSRAAAATEA